MRFLQFIFAAFLLASSVTASACHGVGDVHVICKDGQNAAIYVETENTVFDSAAPDCCPMAGFDLPPENGFAPPANTQRNQPHGLPHHAHLIRADAAATPRAPPTLSLF